MKIFFQIKDQDEVFYYLGISMDIAEKISEIILNQTKYLKKVLNWFNM